MSTKAAIYLTPTPCPVRPREGFTLIEIISVMVMIGILAAAALPRFIGSNAFDTFGFSEQTAGVLRLAQKSAIAKRRTVCVQQVGSDVVMTYAATADIFNCTIDHIDPAEGQKYELALPSGVSVNDLTSTVRFNALGQPVNSSGTVVTATRDIAINGEFTRHIYIEGETGYVH